MTRRGSADNSVFMGDPGRLRERVEADAHLHTYISQQLERVKLEQGSDTYSVGDEFEAQPE
jgi:hypothetical protein